MMTCKDADEVAAHVTGLTKRVREEVLAASFLAAGFFKAAALVGLILLLATMVLPASPALAQHVGTVGGGPPPVPTTKILAIGRLTAKGTPAALNMTLPLEIRATTRLYLAGKIDQWYVQPDEKAVVFLMNLNDLTEARDLLEKLPLGRAGLMTFELIPLGPLGPLRILLTEPAK
jgi:hypothetical protein